MIRLHVLHHQIVRLAALQRGGQIGQPLVHKVDLAGVHDSDLLVHDDIGVVGHAVGHNVLPLKQIHLMVIDTNITDILRNVHSYQPPHRFFISIAHPVGIVIILSVIL